MANEQYKPYIEIRRAENIAGYVFPLSYIKLETFKISPDQRQEFDSYVDGNGVLQRPNVVTHTRTKIEFETTYLYTQQVNDLLTSIWAQLADTLKLECYVRYWDLETRTTKTGYFYMSGTREYTYYNKEIINPIRFAFIEE